VIERLFDHVRQTLGISATTYDIVGHSAGGQFVERLVLFLPSARFRRAVASSPGDTPFLPSANPSPTDWGAVELIPSG
jgi:pimeloyl-ACP methyl ester carboxylesterase